MRDGKANDNEQHDADKWRQSAEKLRGLAEEIADPKGKKAMLELADSLDQFAQAAARPPNPAP